MSTSTTVWYNDYTIYNELLRLSRLHKFNQFTFEYLMKYAVKGSQVILDEIELLNSAEVEDDEKELITKKMLIVLKSYKHQCHDAASLCSLAPSPQGLTNDDEVGVQSANGASDSHVRIQLPSDRWANKFDRGFPSVDENMQDEGVFMECLFKVVDIYSALSVIRFYRMEEITLNDIR